MASLQSVQTEKNTVRTFPAMLNTGSSIGGGMVSVGRTVPVGGMPSVGGTPSVSGTPSVNGMPSVGGTASVSGTPSVSGMPSVDGLIQFRETNLSDDSRISSSSGRTSLQYWALHCLKPHLGAGLLTDRTGDPSQRLNRPQTQNASRPTSNRCSLKNNRS